MDFLTLSYISWPEIILRIFLAMAFGLVLGLDRDRKNKPIDFRAYMIVCVTTCLLGFLAQHLYYDLKDSNDFINLDIGKIIAGALTGIGFLGAGAIIKREDDQVVGTATGASVWAAGSIGLALGFGAYIIALVGFAAIAIILIGGGFFVGKVGDTQYVEGSPDKQKFSTMDKSRNSES